MLNEEEINIIKILVETASEGKSIQKDRVVNSLGSLLLAKDALHSLDVITKTFQALKKELKKAFKKTTKMLAKKIIASRVTDEDSKEEFEKNLTECGAYNLVEDTYVLAAAISTIQNCLNYYVEEYNMVFDKIAAVKSYLR